MSALARPRVRVVALILVALLVMAETALCGDGGDTGGGGDWSVAQLCYGCRP